MRANTVVLSESQVIYLFELGSEVTIDPYTDSGSLSSAQDYQDLVMLVTLAPTTNDLVTGNVINGTIAGEFQINPNTLFKLTKNTGDTVTIDDLRNAAAADLDANGIYYTGLANSLRIKPRGYGNNISVTINGQNYNVKNNKTYTITAPSMNVSVYSAAGNTGGVTGQNANPGSELKTMRDDFNAVAYNLNENVLHWRGDWVEYEDDGLASSGNIRISDGYLRMDDADNGKETYSGEPEASRPEVHRDERTESSLHSNREGG